MSEKNANFDLTQEYYNSINYATLPKLCLLAFLNYEHYNQYIPDRIEYNYQKLEQKYLAKLPFKYQDKVNKVREGMRTNQLFFNTIVNSYGTDFDNVYLTEETIDNFQYEEQSFIGKLFLEMLTREWTEEGREERAKTMLPIIQELKKYYDYQNKELMSKGVKVLVIGSRFGRMIYELARLGYIVEANERTCLYSLIANYILNRAKKNELCICPRISSFMSSFTEKSVTKKHFLPDVDAASELKNIKKDAIKVTKRDFEKEYKDKKDLFDCVVTIFSTDETKNLIGFTETVNQVLKKGGIWINLGGLNNSYEYGGFDLTWEEFKYVIEKSNFEIKREEKPVVPYCKIEGHSLPYTIGVVSFTAQKK